MPEPVYSKPTTTWTTKIIFTSSNHVHCFRDERKITAIENMTFPVKILKQNASTSSLTYSTAASYYSRCSMKKLEMNINFQNQGLWWKCSSGKYIKWLLCYPLTQVKLAINNLDRQPNSTIILTTSDTYEKSNCTIALKVHCQFA